MTDTPNQMTTNRRRTIRTALLLVALAFVNAQVPDLMDWHELDTSCVVSK